MNIRCEKHSALDMQDSLVSFSRLLRFRPLRKRFLRHLGLRRGICAAFFPLQLDFLRTLRLRGRICA